MGHKKIEIDNVYISDGYLVVEGKNFTQWSVIIADGDKLSTVYVDSDKIISKLKEGDETLPRKLSVSQISDTNIVLGSVKYTFPAKAAKNEDQ